MLAPSVLSKLHWKCLSSRQLSPPWPDELVYVCVVRVYARNGLMNVAAFCWISVQCKCLGILLYIILNTKYSIQNIHNHYYNIAERSVFTFFISLLLLNWGSCLIAPRSPPHPPPNCMTEGAVLVALALVAAVTDLRSQQSQTVEKCPQPSFLTTWYRPTNRSPFFTGWYPPAPHKLSFVIRTTPAPHKHPHLWYIHLTYTTQTPSLLIYYLLLYYIQHMHHTDILTCDTYNTCTTQTPPSLVIHTPDYTTQTHSLLIYYLLLYYIHHLHHTDILTCDT